ncbi:MAG: hypothetical protein MI750_15935 [Xanthomonadales bacterium]|jgi:hypothetical protein|nr:hypothetical protein [Xanthomonadales bacterium]
MNEIRDALVGKTITGVMTRPGPSGMPELLMLALEDGSFMQFVMPQKRRQRNKNHPYMGVVSEKNNTFSEKDCPSKSGAVQQLSLIHTICG